MYHKNSPDSSFSTRKDSLLTLPSLFDHWSRSSFFPFTLSANSPKSFKSLNIPREVSPLLFAHFSILGFDWTSQDKSKTFHINRGKWPPLQLHHLQVRQVRVSMTFSPHTWMDRIILNQRLAGERYEPEWKGLWKSQWVSQSWARKWKVVMMMSKKIVVPNCQSNSEWLSAVHVSPDQCTTDECPDVYSEQILRKRILLDLHSYIFLE